MPVSNHAATREVARKIGEEIRARGPISFARFMELALYCPQSGYYERIANTPGRRGDFYTSVSVGSVFGELLAARFLSWIRTAAMACPVILEAGAHEGRLARDILGTARRLDPELGGRLIYLIVEPSARLRERQREELAAFGGMVRWHESLGSVGAEGGIEGVIVSNELLDAMPCFRIVWNRTDGRWMELAVDGDEAGFVWRERAPGAELGPHLPMIPEGLREVLPDRFEMEVSAGAAAWIREAAGVLRRGWLVSFDYGFDGEERWAPHRRHGTARGYVGHRVTGDLLADPGGQDLTAHVDFGAVRATGEEMGLRTETFTTQEAFLGALVRELPELRARASAWSPGQFRQFQTLVHPDHLGRSFRVLVQSRLNRVEGGRPQG